MIMYFQLCLCMTTLTEVFPCFSHSCKANARVKLAKTGHGPHSSTLFVICVVRLLFVFFCVLFVCKCVLPPGDNPIAVNKYIIYIFVCVCVCACTYCIKYETVHGWLYVFAKRRFQESMWFSHRHWRLTSDAYHVVEIMWLNSFFTFTHMIWTKAERHYNMTERNKFFRDTDRKLINPLNFKQMFL